jgi:hypothetical protein
MLSTAETLLQPCAVELGRANVRRLAQEHRDFTEAASPTSFYVHNVFIPTAKHKARHAGPVLTQCGTVLVAQMSSNGGSDAGWET